MRHVKRAWARRSPKGEGGFTLIEVMVALAIASGALILILSANGASLRKSVRAQEDVRVLRAAESKLAELHLGIERSAEGPLPGCDGLRWESRSAREEGLPLKGLTRLTFVVRTPDGSKRLDWSELR